VIEVAGAPLLVVLMAILISSLRLGSVPHCGKDEEPPCPERLDVALALPGGKELLIALALGVLVGLVLAALRSKRPNLNPLLLIWSPVEIADRTIMRSGLKSAWALVPFSALLSFLSQWLAELLP